MSNIIDFEYEKEKREMMAKAESVGLSLASVDGEVLDNWRRFAQDWYEKNIRKNDDDGPEAA